MTYELQPVIEQPPTPPSVVGRDVACRRCAYNLRGLTANSLCPECQAPVAISLGNDQLRFSEPAYLETLRRGIHLIFAGVVASIAGGIISVVLLRGAEGQALTGLLHFAASIVMIIGSWMLTNPDPSGLGEDRYGKIRQTIRICLIVGVFDDLLGVMLSTAMIPAAVIPGMRILSVVASIANLVGELALLEYLARLAARLPDPGMADTARNLLKVIGICNGIIIVGAIFAVVMGTQLGSGLMIFGCGAAIAGLVLLVFYIRYLVLLGNFAGRFRLEAEQSRMLWAVAQHRANPQP